MKSIITTSILVSYFFVACITNIKAQSYTANDSLDINNIGARINVLGDNFDNLATGESAFDAPINSNFHTIYVSALWIGGYENGSLKEAAMTYRQSGIDFYPGPLDTTNASISSTVANKWDNIWKIKRTEVNDFIKNGTIYSSIANWPGNKDSGTNESNLMAPYVNVSGGKTYNPLKGDYPDMKGDEMLWWVMNDKGGPHGETRGNPMGIEVRGEAYAFNDTSSDAVNNTIFIDYKIINRSNTDIDSAFIGLFTNFEIGYTFDDYIGYAPKSHAYYGYSGVPIDPIYGTGPPMESIIFLKDSLSRFLAFNNSADTINGNPGFPNPNPADYYNYLTGRWKNGACIKYGQDGIKGTQCSDFMYDGDPSDSTSGWTEHNVGNLPGDRRGVGSIGPVTIKAGQTFDVPVAYVYVSKGNLAANYQTSNEYWKQIQEYYNTNYTTSGINHNIAPKMAVNIYPNPASTKIFINCPNGNLQKTVIIDMTGRIIFSSAVSDPDKMQSVDISGLSNGIYTVLAETKGGISSQKLVVTR